MIKACKGALGVPTGGGMEAIKRSKRSSIPILFLALTKIASCAGMPIISSISLITRSGSA